MNWHTATVKFQVQSEWGALVGENVSLVEGPWQVFQEKAVDENGAKQQGRDGVSTWPFVRVIFLQYFNLKFYTEDRNFQMIKYSLRLTLHGHSGHWVLFAPHLCNNKTFEQNHPLWIKWWLYKLTCISVPEPRPVYPLPNMDHPGFYRQIWL